jgi:hypothetical protein
METNDTVLPHANSAAGASGVSPAFSILPEKLAEHTVEFEHALIDLIAPPVGVGDFNGNVEAFNHRIENVAHSVEALYQDTNTSIQSMNVAATEIFRQQYEIGMRFLEDLVVARTPVEVMNLQVEFFKAQFDLFTAQAKEVQGQFARFAPGLKAPNGK